MTTTATLLIFAYIVCGIGWGMICVLASINPMRRLRYLYGPIPPREMFWIALAFIGTIVLWPLVMVWGAVEAFKNEQGE